jgi:hypothetical protein
LVERMPNGNARTTVSTRETQTLLTPNETKLTGPPPRTFARSKARTGGSG